MGRGSVGPRTWGLPGGCCRLRLSAPSPCAGPRGQRPAPPYEQKRHPILTCFSTLTTRPIILISSTASVSEGPLSPFSRAFRSPGPRPTIWSTLWKKVTCQSAQSHATSLKISRLPAERGDTACTGRGGPFAPDKWRQLDAGPRAPALRVFRLAEQRHHTQA